VEAVRTKTHHIYKVRNLRTSARRFAKYSKSFSQSFVKVLFLNKHSGHFDNVYGPAIFIILTRYVPSIAKMSNMRSV